jgi:hypothetical protein
MDIYLPTQAEIRKQCTDIRSMWSSRELFKRAGETEPTGWMPPGTERPLNSRSHSRQRADED